MPRRTKIIATLGPATDDPDILRNTLAAGVDVVRLNFSHGDADTHRQRAQAVRECAAQLGRHVAIMADLQGPKIRTERFENGKVQLTVGDKFILDATCPSDAGNQTRVGITYKQLPKDVRKGDTLLLDDGLINLQVEHVTDTAIECCVSVGGVLSNNKGINRLGGGLSAQALTHKDRTDITVAAELQVDYVAVSFPRNAEDIKTARQLLQAAGSNAGIVAKIERAEAIDRHEEIINASDAIMVARGDLGVEIGMACVPHKQKLLIRKARDLNKVAITATQMMESMRESPMPTRAEVSDVANAVLDGTDAVMLSAETAAGRHPALVVAEMARVCHEAEKQPAAQTSDHRMTSRFGRIDESIAMAVMYTANHLNVRAIAALTESGSTPLWMSRISSDTPIYALSQHISTQKRVTLYRGVYALDFHDLANTDTLQANRLVVDELLKRGAVSQGDLIIITKGDLKGIPGGTNLMKIVCVE